MKSSDFKRYGESMEDSSHFMSPHFMEFHIPESHAVWVADRLEWKKELPGAWVEVKKVTRKEKIVIFINKYVNKVIGWYGK